MHMPWYSICSKDDTIDISPLGIKLEILVGTGCVNVVGFGP